MSWDFIPQTAVSNNIETVFLFDIRIRKLLAAAPPGS